MPGSKTRVAVIGGGAAGLVVARHLSANPETFSFTLFEQTGRVGGTWIYTDETERDSHGLPVHSSMYRNLRTNLPKEIMQIPDFPFDDEDGPSFVHHSVIRDYLWNYARHFNVYPYAKFNTLVQLVEPEILASGRTGWSVTSKDLETNRITTRTYDAVVLCNGHFTVGNAPHIRGLDSFSGNCIHSHRYRYPEKYAGKIVCILGASWSGMDIALEVAQHAEKVYLSHNLTELMTARMPENIIQRPGISSIHDDLFVFKDGTSVHIDDLILCTGYHFTYPFLSDKVELKTKENHVQPIYKHLVHTDVPNLFFMGLPALVIPFPLFHIQAQYILKVIEGHIKLPSSQEMRKEFENEKQMLLKEGISIRHIIKLRGDRQWNYYDQLATAANVPSLPPVIKKIWDHISEMREQDLLVYKNYQYRIIDRNNFTVKCCKPC